MSSIAKSFEEHQVVPEVVSKAPSGVAHVQYPSGVEVNYGNVLTPTQVKEIPAVSWDAAVDQFYTVAFIDPDVPSRKEPTYRECQHWLVVNVPGSDIAAGETLAPYFGSGPPPDSGLHRYVFLVYRQPGKLEFDEPRLSRSADNRVMFSIANFAKKYNMGDPVAGNYYQAEYDDYVPLLYKELGA